MIRYERCFGRLFVVFRFHYELMNDIFQSWFVQCSIASEMPVSGYGLGIGIQIKYDHDFCPLITR